MRDRLLLGLYAAAVVGATLVHEPAALAAALLVAAALAGRDAPRVARRALIAVVITNAVVSISYGIAMVLRGAFRAEVLLLLNLRVYLLMFLAILVAERVNLVRALSCSRTLAFVLVLAHGQIAGFRRLLDDARAALRSRSIGRVTLATLYRHAAATGSSILAKSIHQAAEITDAMRARGVLEE